MLKYSHMHMRIHFQRTLFITFLENPHNNTATCSIRVIFHCGLNDISFKQVVTRFDAEIPTVDVRECVENAQINTLSN